MSEPNMNQPVAGGETGGCRVDAFQRACVEVDIAVEPSAEVRRIAVQCMGEPQLAPLGTRLCGTAFGTCGFTVAQNLCVGVRIAFEATATQGDVRANCEPPSFTNCFEE